MVSIELIFDLDCPNVETARENLAQALAEAGIAPYWQEWDRAAPETPAHAKEWGSPTILVGGRDVAGERGDAGAACCRLYGAGPGKTAGAPAVEAIKVALTGG